MKHILCPIFVVLLVVNYAQAAEVPYIELKGYTGAIRSIQFSTDGKRITIAGHGEIYLWDAESGKELYAITGGQHSQFSRDGKKIALPSDAGTHIWDAELGKKICTLPERFREFFFSPDRKKIMTWRDSNGPYQIWDAESGKELYALTSQSDRWSGFFPTFTPDGKKIRIVDGVGGITGNDSKIRFFNVETGKELVLPGRHNGFSPDGKKMFSWDDRSEVRIWDDESGKELFTLPGTFGGFSPDGKRIITSNEDKTHIWDADSGEELYILPGLHRDFSPDSKRILTQTNNGPYRIWDAESGKEAYTLTGMYVGFTDGGKKIVTWSNTETHILDFESGKEVSVLPARCSYLSFSPDGKKVVAHGFPDGISVYDVESRKALYSAPGRFDRFDRFSPGGKAIVTSITVDAETDMSYEVAHVWNAETGRAIVLTGTFTGFSPDGNKIVSVNDNKTHIWDAETGKELHVLPGKSCGITPDGKPITVMADNTIRIWDLSMVVE